MLTGLIIACEEIAGGGGVRAELPVAGQTLLERQARLLVEEGAARILIVAERLPPGLASAAARLRRDGITTDIVRQVDEIAQRLQPDERVVVLGDGVLTDSIAVRKMLATASPAILVLPDGDEMRAWELIDASARWAGLMLTDGDMIRRTARMLGDWDLQSTLLRNAVQAGAERVRLDPARPPMLLALLDGPEAALAAEQVISRTAGRQHTGLVDRYLFDPVARLLAPRAMAAMIDPDWLRGGAVGATLAAALVLIGGWLWPGLLLALLAGPVDALGRHLEAMSPRSRRDRKRWRPLRLAASGAALLALAITLRATDGWGTLALAAATGGVMAALIGHERWIGAPARRPLWIAEPDNLTWLLLPFALAGWWTAGLAGQALLALVSLLALQRLTGR